MADATSQTCESCCNKEGEQRSANMQSQSSKNIKERLEYLKSHIMNVEQLTKDYEKEGIVIPDADKFIHSCETIKKKIDQHKSDVKINHLKDHVAELEDLTTEVRKGNLNSKSFDDFLKSCEEFKEKLDQGKAQDTKPLNEGDKIIISKINAAIELSKEAKEEGLISCSIEKFLKSCEHMKNFIKNHKSETTPAPPLSSVDVMKTLRCNINHMMDLMSKSKSNGALKSNIEEFLKTCDSFKSKLSAKLAHTGSQSDPCRCDICTSNNDEETKSFCSAYRANGGEMFTPSKTKNQELCPNHTIKSRNSCSCLQCICAVDTKSSKSFPSLARIPEGEVFRNDKQKKGDASICSTCNNCVCDCKTDTKEKAIQTKAEEVCCARKKEKKEVCDDRSAKSLVTCNCPNCKCDSDGKEKSFYSICQMPGGEVFSKPAPCAVRASKGEISYPPDKTVTAVESFHSVKKMSGGEVFAREDDNAVCINEICNKRTKESKSFHSYGRLTDVISLRSSHSSTCGCNKCICPSENRVKASKSLNSSKQESQGLIGRVISTITNSIRNLTSSAHTSDKKTETSDVGHKTMSGGETCGVMKKEAPSSNSSKKSFILRRFKKRDVDSPSSSSVPKRSCKTLALYNKCLGHIEKHVRKIVKISRIRNPDGTIKEVKETITIKQKRCPRDESCPR